MTNEEWIKGLSTDTLADLFVELTGYVACGLPFYFGPDEDHISKEEAREKWVAWLQKERKDDERREDQKPVHEGVG